MKPIDIRPADLDTVRRILSEHVPSLEVRAFGSRVAWQARETSDLDLALMTDEPLSVDRTARLRAAFTDSDLPFRVDIVDWASTSESFRRVVEAEYVVLQPPFPRNLDAEGGWTSINLGRTCIKIGSGATPRGGKDVYLPSGPYALIRSQNVLKGDFRHEGSAYIGEHHASELSSRDVLDGDVLLNITGDSVARACQVDPHVREQRTITHILGTLDDKIELNRRMNATLEAMARALFKSWFVDFDPVRAKMAGRDTGLPKEIADLFPDQLVETAIGRVPEGWAVVSLTELMNVNPKRSLLRGQVAPYLDMANMPTRGHVPDSIVDRPAGSGMRFTNGDTLVARITPCLENGKTAYVDFLRASEVGWGSTEYIVLKPKHPLPDEFAYCVARSAGFREFAIRNMSGTRGRQRVPAAALDGFAMSSPPAPVAARFGHIARSLFGRARWAALESRALAHIRDALLPKLVSGELRIGNDTRAIGRTAGVR